MPNNPRAQIKRDLLAAINHVGKVYGLLNSIAGVYKEAAPGYVDRYEVAGAVTMQLAELLEAIRNET